MNGRICKLLKEHSILADKNYRTLKDWYSNLNVIQKAYAVQNITTHNAQIKKSKLSEVATKLAAAKDASSDKK